MISRKFAAAALSAGLLLSTSACSFNPTPESLQSYAPSDGSGADLNLGDGQGVKLRNFVYLTNGTDGALIGVIVNQGSDDQNVSLYYAPEGEAEQSETVVVKAFSSYSFGFNGNPASSLTLAGKAGDIATVTFGTGDNSEFTRLSIPILDATYDYYSSIVEDIDGFLGRPVLCADAPVAALFSEEDPTLYSEDDPGMQAGNYPTDCINPSVEATN